jgi:hypothetical protein
MNEDISNNFDPNDMNLHKRLKGLGKNLSVTIPSTKDEMLLGHYPYLTNKELVICEMIISARWDIGDTFYNAIVEKTIEVHKKLFHNNEEVEATIEQLCKKGVLKNILWFLKFGHTVECDSNSWDRILLHPVKLLNFTKDEVLGEGFMIISGMFESPVKQFFGPIEQEEP